MAIRRLLRGQLSAAAVEPIVAAVAQRYDLSANRVTFLEADNWLSTPLVIDDEVFVKIITDRHSLVHALLTAGRNLGAFSSGTAGFFGHYDSPVEMAEHELAATQRMRELGVNVPEPLEAFEVDGFGVLVLEYLPEFRTLDQLDAATVEGHAPDLFAALSTMHADGLVHGDLRAENVLVADGDLYFIDATNVRGDGLDDARAYDVACALGALAPEIGARAAVAAALTAYSPADLLNARAFLDFVNIRPDHSFDAAAVKGEIEREAT
ncbi:RIO1 family regulatory kinase/ATPase domain-containing protein [Halorientalis regularis]|uniref:non-specific serine/threonine protein kinase n=1 Tax=Halorientalis regularis TaxID=660518 RepID=A0A1G7QAD2_9EURY|nr:RIO1 family regulatory kinase/ATPase [Halorientalis regularis]SDF94540.1 RIO1 family protein [Halorientalis regularis]